MYSIIYKHTGLILASHLTLGDVDSWLTRNEFKYESFRFVGLTVEVTETLKAGISRGWLQPALDR